MQALMRTTFVIYLKVVENLRWPALLLILWSFILLSSWNICQLLYIFSWIILRLIFCTYGAWQYDLYILYICAYLGGYIMTHICCLFCACGRFWFDRDILKFNRLVLFSNYHLSWYLHFRMSNIYNYSPSYWNIYELFQLVKLWYFHRIL